MANAERFGAPGRAVAQTALGLKIPRANPPCRFESGLRHQQACGLQREQHLTPRWRVPHVFRILASTCSAFTLTACSPSVRIEDLISWLAIGCWTVTFFVAVGALLWMRGRAEEDAAVDDDRQDHP